MPISNLHRKPRLLLNGLTWRKFTVEWSLFIRGDGSHLCLILIYVDDILILSTFQDWEEEELNLLKEHLTLTDIDKITRYPNINISQSDDRLHISSISRAWNMLQKWEPIDTDH